MAETVQLLAFIRFLESHQTNRDPRSASIVYVPGRFTWLSTETPRTALLEFLRLARTFTGTQPPPIELREVLEGQRPIFVMREADNAAFQVIGEVIKSLDSSFADRALAVVQHREHIQVPVRLAIQFSVLSLLLSISVSVFVNPLPAHSSDPDLAKLIALTRDSAQLMRWSFASVTLLAVVHTLFALIVRNRVTRAYFADPLNTLRSGVESR